jgi:hypothetical protein
MLEGALSTHPPGLGFAFKCDPFRRGRETGTRITVPVASRPMPMMSNGGSSFRRAARVAGCPITTRAKA